MLKIAVLLIYLFIFNINLNAIENLFFEKNELNVEKRINNFIINIKNNRLIILNENTEKWFIRIKNLEKNEQIINGYLYEKKFEKDIIFGTYNIYIKDLKTNQELVFNVNYNTQDINKKNNLIIDLLKFKEEQIFKNVEDNSYGINFTKDANLNFYFYNKEPIFIRLSNFGKNILNGYFYSSFTQSLDEGVYSLYIKTKNSQIEKVVFISGINNGINKDLNIKKVNMVRDIPYISNNEFIFQWYPVMYYNIESKYLIQFKKDFKITSFITDKPYYKTKETDNKYDYYRVVAYPSIVSSSENPDNLISLYTNIENIKWIKIGNPKDTNYLVGEESLLEGDISDLSLYLPSGFAFTDKKNEYIITSADKGEIIYVKDNKFKRYIYKNDIGMPLNLAYPIYMGNNKFILTDDTNSRIVEFDIITANLKTIFGDDGKFESQEFKNVLEKKDKLGIVSQMYKYNNNIHLSFSLKFKENPNAWYSIPKSNPMIYRIYEDRLLKENIDICDKIKCKSLFTLKNYQIITTSEEIIKYEKNRVIWQHKINGFGAGLVFLNNGKELLYGNHTELLRIDTKTGKKINIESNIKFANIIDIDKINEEEFVITDSDSGTVYFTKLIGNKLELVNAISNDVKSIPNIIKIKEINKELFILTSNPSYLYKMNLENYKIDFLIGNGNNSPAMSTNEPLKTSMSYPNDFFIDENNVIYISEANNRILSLDKNKLSIFAGSRYNGKAIGKNNCDDALFTNVRSIIKIDDNLIVSDSGNNRLLSLNKIDNICYLNEINLQENNENIKFNYLTYLFKNKKDNNFVIEQNANRILNFNDNFELIDVIGSRRNTIYQGMGKDNEFTVNKGEANFSTPVDICFNSTDIYIADLFNGKIKILENKGGGTVSTLNLINRDYILPRTCTIYEDNLFYVNGLTNKLYINKLTKGN